VERPVTNPDSTRMCLLGVVFVATGLRRVVDCVGVVVVEVEVVVVGVVVTVDVDAVVVVVCESSTMRASLVSFFFFESP